MFVGLVVLVLSWPASQRLEFDRSITAMFSPNDPTIVAYRDLQKSFGGNSVVMLVYRDTDSLSEQGILRNDTLSRRVERIVGVKGVLSPAILNRAVEKLQPMSLISGGPALFQKGEVAMGFDRLFAGYTHSQDHTRFAVVAMLDPEHSPETIDRLREIAINLPGDPKYHIDGVSPITSAAIVGEPVLVHDGFNLIERDGARLATLTVGLLSLVVIFTLADLRFVLLTTIMIAWSVVVTKAAVVWLGIDLSIVSSILTAIVTVIAVAAALHLGVRFRIARARGSTRLQSTVCALSRLLVPIAITCATDAAGFAALYGSRILPIRQFGLMIAISAVAVCISVLLFAPALMMMPGTKIFPGIHRRQQDFSRRLRRSCVRLALWCIGHSKTCIVATAVITAIILVGLGRGETETSFLNNFRADSPVVQAYADVEANLGGAGVWDVVLEAPNELTTEFLDQVRLLENSLREIEIDGARLTKVLSVADAEQIASQAAMMKLVTPTVRLSAMQFTMPVFFNALLTSPQSEKRELRIMLRSQEQLDADQKRALIRAVEEEVASAVATSDWQDAADRPRPGRVTGYYVVMARLVGQLVADQWRCFAASGLMVWLLLVVATRSLKLATAALVPNLLPIFLVLALVGIFGGKINMGAAMIAAVSIGLSIDGSVHFLSSYQRCRRRGHDARWSSIHAAGGIGVPVLLATVALVVGFGVLSTSEFVPTATFGLLVAATLAMGTAVNLSLLPATVAWIDRDTKSISNSPISNSPAE